MVSADPGNVTMIQVTPKDRSVFVSWNTTSQEECAGAVLHYTVFYGGQTEPMLSKFPTDVNDVFTCYVF